MMCAVRGAALGSPYARPGQRLGRDREACGSALGGDFHLSVASYGRRLSGGQCAGAVEGGDEAPLLWPLLAGGIVNSRR